MKNNFILIVCFFLFGNSKAQLPQPVILPSPQKCTVQQQVCNLNKLKNIKRIYKAAIQAEGYKLEIDENGVTITTGGHAGYIYAMQTLRLLQLQYEQFGKIFCMTIEDAPQMKWRSFLLDSGRQYQQIGTLKKYIDLLSLLKFNYFHWHLTEGLGWRIEIKKYPLLTKTGAFVATGPQQQGFYTQSQIKEMVQYAKARNITVVPEIDMPGHAEAALNAYPFLDCFNQKPAVPQTGFTPHIFCAGKPTTLVFLKNVLKEVCQIFPSPYIHLGGDEAPKDNWDKCPDCQKKIKQLGLKNSHDLQLWFSAQMAEYLKTKGKKAIFWEDVVHSYSYPLPQHTVIQWWNWRAHKDSAYKKAIENGLQVIAGTNYYTYLNFPITAWSGYNKDRTFDIRDIYEHNPSYYIDANPLLIGMSGALWTDFNVTENMIDRRVLPRIFALSQQMWYKGAWLSFDDFYSRVNAIKPVFEKISYGFGPGLRSEVPENYKWD